MRPRPEAPRAGQESVWDYPRPAKAEATESHLLVRHRGVTLAETRSGVRTLETSHPPTYYFPPQDVALDYFEPVARSSFCEWKGSARYFDILVVSERLEAAAWCYPRPSVDFEILRDFLAFYPALFDECRVDGELAKPQPGGFYGGWITDRLAGPFKGSPGTRHW